MKLVLWLILFFLILIFAPGILGFLFAGSVVVLDEIVSDPFWKYFLYAVGGIIVVGLSWELMRPLTLQEKKKRDYHREQLEKIKDPRMKAEYIENMRKDIKKEMGLEDK